MLELLKNREIGWSCPNKSAYTSGFSSTAIILIFLAFTLVMTNHDSKHLALAPKPTMFALAKKIKSKLWANIFGEKNQHFLSLPISDRFKKKELGPLPPLLKQQPNFFGFDFRFDPKKNLSNNFRRIAFFHSSKWDCFISETFFKFKLGVIQTKDRPNVCFFSFG